MTGGALPVVAVIGRPNVGKSTLFNRIVGERKAIVHDQPGVTRDRIYHRVEWEGVPFMLVDTGGFDPGEASWDVRTVFSQAARALDEASVVIFVVDAAAGTTALDLDVARVLRRSGKPVVLAVNKVDHPKRASLGAEFAALGFHPLHEVSAEHGIGIGDLLDAVAGSLPGAPAALAAGAEPTRVAVVGRPNVGKSTLVNCLLGEDRLIIHDQPGTTRDAVDTHLERDGREYVLVDTAGIRRRGRVQEPVEKFSVVRAKEAIGRCHLCLLVIDVREMVTDQDTKIAGMVEKAGRGCIILVNKWDLMKGVERSTTEKMVRRAMPFMDYAPVLFVSAATGLGTEGIFPLVDEVRAETARRIPTPELNRFLQEAITAYRPGSFHGRPVSFGYMNQVKDTPPTFLVFTNEPSRVHFTYRRYLVNRLRERFGFRGTPVFLKFKRRPGKPARKRERGRPA